MPNAAEIRKIVFDALATNQIDLAQPWREDLLGDGKDPAGLTLLGRLCAEEGNLAAGLAYTGEAMRQDPLYADASVHRGNMLANSGFFAEAAECYDRVLLFSPFHDEALEAYTAASQRAGRPHNVVKALQLRIRLGGETPAICNSLGLALHSANDLQGALNAYNRAIALSPQTPLYYSNAATIYYHLERYDDALLQLETALQIDPDFATAWQHTGNVLKAMRKLPQAEEAYRRSIALNPDHAEVHFSLGCTLLQQDKWAEGWSEYEWRWKVPGLVAPIHIDIPKWAGEDIRGRSVLVVAEQGSGDSIQYIRYARSLIDLGAKVFVWAPRETAALFRRLPYVEHSATNRFELAKCDYYVPIMSLPHLLQCSAEHIPSAPYLTHDPQLLARFARELGPRQENLRIGLAWAGNPIQVEDRHRSANLAALAPLFSVPNVRWISLQKSSASEQIAPSGLPIEDWSPRLDTLDDTAALMTALDGVVSVCSAPIHLAGALGVRSVAMLAWAADWRWREDDVRTPYYPNMRITRMKSLNDWKDVAKRTAQIVTSWKPNTSPRA